MTVSRALYRSSDLINDPSFFRFLRHPRLLLMLLYFLSFSFFFLFFSSYYGTEISLLVAAMFRYLYQAFDPPFQPPRYQSSKIELPSLVQRIPMSPDLVDSMRTASE